MICAASLLLPAEQVQAQARPTVGQAPGLAARPAAAAPAVAATAAVNPAGPEYILRGGDAVKITVYQNVDLSIEARVSEGGFISYPLLGNVQLGGRTVSQAEAAIADGLRRGGFVRDPQVTLLVTQVRGNQANVLGQVNRPGRYPLEVAGMRLTDLLSLAGGAMVGGSDTVVLTGTRNGQPYRAEVDVPSIFRSANPAENVLVQDGDNVFVDRAPTAYIYGEVQKPGPLALLRDMTLLQGLASGGGLTQRGTERGIRIHRRGDRGEVMLFSPRSTDLLRDGDVIYVRESLF